jgi:hypothetical protein
LHNDYLLVVIKCVSETLIYWLYERIISLRGTRSIAYHVDMTRLLRSVRRVLHLVRRMDQRFLLLLPFDAYFPFTMFLSAVAFIVVTLQLERCLSERLLR